MSCIDKNELEQFLKGKLAPARMLEVDAHIRDCGECKCAAMCSPVQAEARVRIGSNVTGAADCPEYEELSAYVDACLSAEVASSILSHANSCECCSRDLDRIREIRSHAALRDPITVTPGASRAPSGFWFYFKRMSLVAAAAGIAGIALVHLSFAPMTATKPTQVALNNNPAPPIANNTIKPPAPTMKPGPLVAPVKQPASGTANVAENPNPPAEVPAPVLKDGPYTVVNGGKGMVLAKANGRALASSLGHRIAAQIAEKLRTGQIGAAQTVQTAIVAVKMRDGSAGFKASPTSPKPVAPVGKVVLSTTPTLRWSAVDLAQGYRVRMYDAQNNQVLEQETTATSLTLPKSLERGKVYSWEVAVRFGALEDYGYKSASVKFAVVSADDFAAIRRVQSGLPGSHLALGTAYESAGLYDEAQNEFRALRRANPHSRLAQKLLYGAAQH